MVYVKMVNRKQIWCSSCRDHLKIYIYIYHLKIYIYIYHLKIYRFRVKSTNVQSVKNSFGAL